MLLLLFDAAFVVYDIAFSVLAGEIRRRLLRI